MSGTDSDDDPLAEADHIGDYVASLIRNAVGRVARDVSRLKMSEADVSTCVSAQLREIGMRVEEQFPVVPVWVSEGGSTVALHARRAHLAVWHPRRDKCVLVELKVRSGGIEERYRQQAAAYAAAHGSRCLLAVVQKTRTSPPAFEEFGDTSSEN